MSHYVELTTQIKDRKALVSALERMGFKDKVEVHDTAQNLYGYQGDVRPQKAHVIIRRQHIGPSSNDVGYEKGSDGFFRAHISEFDSAKGAYHTRTDAVCTDEWQEKVGTWYGVECAKYELENQGLSYKEDLDEKQRPRLRVFY